MTLTVRDTASGPTANSAVALPAGAQVGDLIVAVVQRAGSTSPPTLPSGWTSVIAVGSNAVALRVATRVMQTGDTTAVFTSGNGGYVFVAFVGDPGVAVGAVGGSDTGTGSPGSIPLVTLGDADGSSRVLTVLAHRDATAIDTPDGATEVVEQAGNVAGSRIAVSLTGLTTSWTGDASVPITLAGVAAGQGWLGAALEVTGPNAITGVTGTGSLTATAATLSGSGTLTATGTGSLTATPATLTGSGTLTDAGAGALTAPAATLTGSGTLTTTGTGTLTAQPATLTGSGTVGDAAITGGGSLAATPATLAGTGTLTVVGTGDLAAAAATLAGNGLLQILGAGALVAAAATLSGSGTLTDPVTGTGALVAAAATLSGSGAVRHPTGTAPERVITIAAENRVVVVPAENRTVVI